jgi:hypothetical protein
LPSQQVGKVIMDRIPPTQGDRGRVAASGEPQFMLLLSPVEGMHLWQTLWADVEDIEEASPTSMRKPGLKAVTVVFALEEGICFGVG